jgi:hypothetical protein
MKKSEYYLDLVDRIFMRLEPTKMTIMNDMVYRDLLSTMARVMVEDLESENDPASKAAIAELLQFANELEETLEESVENFVIAPKVFRETPQSDGTIEWFKTLIDRLDEELIYPEMDLLLEMIDIIADNPEEEDKLERIDLLLQENSSLLSENFIEAIDVWTNEKLEELESESDRGTILITPITIAEVMKQLSTKYGENAWKVVVGCYEIVSELESDEEKLAMWESTLKTCREALAAYLDDN